MVETIVNNMSRLVDELQEYIKLDIEDIKLAKHEELLKRNDYKHNIIDEISNLKIDLNQQLMKEMQAGVDVNVYREDVDRLEEKLKELHILNRRLASIVLPIQQMYKELVEEIEIVNGGKTFDIKA